MPHLKNSFIEQFRKWVMPPLVATCTWLILDKLNTVLDELKQIPGISTKIALHDAHLQTLDENYNMFRGEFKELEQLVGTKEDRIEFPPPPKKYN